MRFRYSPTDWWYYQQLLLDRHGITQEQSMRMTALEIRQALEKPERRPVGCPLPPGGQEEWQAMTPHEKLAWAKTVM